MSLHIDLNVFLNEEDLTQTEKAIKNFPIKKDSLEAKALQEVGRKLYELEIEYYDYSNVPLLDGFRGQFSFFGMNFGKDRTTAMFRRINDPNALEVHIPIDEIGRKKERETVFYYDRLDKFIQKNNVKPGFFNEFCRDDRSCIITKKSDVERIVELSMDPEYTKRVFLDNFNEGETFLYLSY